MTEKQSWWVYLIRCSDKSLYCGIATDVERRFEEHLSTANREPKAKGAKYFYGRKPLEVVYAEACETRSIASKREAEIKKLPKQEKLKLIA